LVDALMRLVGPAPTLAEDAATKRYVDEATADRVEQVLVDFGPVDGETTATGAGYAEWVREGSPIVCVPASAGTADHSAEDAAVEGVLAVVTYAEPGIGFDVLAFCPGGTWGTYLFDCRG
jgi:hypothetical protein